MVNLKTIRLPVSANIKLVLVAFAFAIVAGTLLYTNHLVDEMRRSERRTIQLLVGMFTRAASAPQDAVGPDQHSSADLMSDLALQLVATIDFPLIVTDKYKKIEARVDPVTGRTNWDDVMKKNVPIDTSLPPREQFAELEEYLQEMAGTYEPLPIYSVTPKNRELLNYVFYDDSKVVKQLQMLPFIEIVIISMFIVVGYISFSYIKRNEQSNIWVGMAKETAHQLGTPLSSLLGWIELLRYMPEDTTQVLEAADEMQRDVDRLNKIALRFSKIGSAAEVKPTELNALLRNVTVYFERRLPHLGKKVSLVLEETKTPLYVAINTDLFEWVFENLVRNGADAISQTDGRIVIRVHDVRGTAIIDVIDNGRGIDPKIRKDIFRPGFSTKQRGWGLGLSLAKRIVEEYHGGKIVLKQSSSSGTIFRVRLPAVAPPPDVPAPEPQATVQNQ